MSGNDAITWGTGQNQGYGMNWGAPQIPTLDINNILKGITPGVDFNTMDGYSDFANNFIRSGQMYNPETIAFNQANGLGSTNPMQGFEAPSINNTGSSNGYGLQDWANLANIGGKLYNAYANNRMAGVAEDDLDFRTKMGLAQYTANQGLTNERLRTRQEFRIKRGVGGTNADGSPQSLTQYMAQYGVKDI